MSTTRIFQISRRILVPLLFALTLAGAQLPVGQSAISGGGSPIGFENFALGDLNGQAGWTSGHGSSFCPLYDVGVVPNTYGYPSFGAQSLRISNAITCGSFNDQTFSPSLTDEAGETSAATSGYSGGTRQQYFEAQWDFASTVPGSEQPGLSVVASADRGDPARMSWLQMTDTPSGLQLNFNDFQGGVFVATSVASGLDRTIPHTVKMAIEFLDGPGNDIVRIYLDGVLIHTGTTWEDYFRSLPSQPAPVDSIMFRVAGTAAPGVSGNGFLIDNFSSYSGPAVPSADLTGLSLSSGTLAPAFDPATTAYSASVDNATTNVAVSATTNPGATAVVSGGSSLAVGSNTITITVTAANGVTTKTYTVTVTRAALPTATPTPPSPPPASSTAPITSPVSPALIGVPDLTGLTADQARALLISRGFTVGTVTTKLSTQAANTVIGQDPWPLPASLPLGAAINIVLSLHPTATTPLVVKVSASRRSALAIRHAFTPRILTSTAATATITLTGFKNIRRTYVTWSRPLRAGANYLTLKIPAHLKIKLPGIYRLTFRVKANGQSKLYSVPLRLASRTVRVPLPKRQADVLLLTTPSITVKVVRRLSARYLVKTVDTETVFTKSDAPNERVGAVVLDANEAGLSTIRHLHRVFPDLHIVAVVNSAAASKLAKAAGASITVVKPTSADRLAARLTQALKTTLGK